MLGNIRECFLSEHIQVQWDSKAVYIAQSGCGASHLLACGAGKCYCSAAWDLYLSCPRCWRFRYSCAWLVLAFERLTPCAIMILVFLSGRLHQHMGPEGPLTSGNCCYASINLSELRSYRCSALRASAAVPPFATRSAFCFAAPA